jgi:hypothetical protein
MGRTDDTAIRKDFDKENLLAETLQNILKITDQSIDGNRNWKRKPQHSKPIQLFTHLGLSVEAPPVMAFLSQVAGSSHCEALVSVSKHYGATPEGVLRRGLELYAAEAGRRAFTRA